MENVGMIYEHMEYLGAIWYTYGPLVHLVVIWYIFPIIGILCQEKSGNPARDQPGSVQLSII
jgi:ABC-type polysaccharide/polyol phosphate export permease